MSIRGNRCGYLLRLIISKLRYLLLERTHHAVPDLRIDKELNIHETLSTVHRHAINDMRIGSEDSYISVPEIAGVVAGFAMVSEMRRLESIESAVRTGWRGVSE